jgi:hypothetical protein
MLVCEPDKVRRTSDLMLRLFGSQGEARLSQPLSGDRPETI